MSFLKPQVIFQETNPLYLYSSNITYFLQKYPIKVQIFRLLTAWVKVIQIPHVIFQTKKSVFLLRSFLSAMRDHFFVLFQPKLYVLLTKLANQSANFQTWYCLHLKLTKFPMLFLEQRVTYSSNFASLFRVMRHNSSVLFNLNLYMRWTKGAHHSANFQTFNCSHKN